MIPIVPMFLPVLAGIVARGAAVVGRLAVGAGRAIAANGGKFGQTIGKAAQRAGVAMQRGAQQTGGRGLGRGNSPFAPGGAPAGGSRRRRPVVQGQGGRRRGRGRRSVNFSPAKRRQFRQQMRHDIRRNNVASFVQNLFGRQSGVGKIAQHFIQPPGQGPRGRSGFGGGGGGNGIQLAVDPIQLGKDMANTFGSVTKSIVTMPKLIKDWGASLIESRRHLAEFSATHAIALGRLDIGRRSRNVRLGAATGGSFTSMTQSQNRLEERLLPYQVATVNLMNRMVTLLQQIAVAGIDAAEFTNEAAKTSSRTYLVIDMIRQLLVGNVGAAVNNPLADLSVAIGNGPLVQRKRPPMPAGTPPLPPGFN